MKTEITVASYYNQGSSFLISCLYENFFDINAYKTHTKINEIESDNIILVYSDPRDSYYSVENIKKTDNVEKIKHHYNMWNQYNTEFEKNVIHINFYDLVFNYDKVIKSLSQELQLPIKNNLVNDNSLKYKKDTFYLRWIGIHKFLWNEDYRISFYNERKDTLNYFGFDYDGCHLCSYNSQGFPKVGK